MTFWISTQKVRLVANNYCAFKFLMVQNNLVHLHVNVDAALFTFI